MNLLLDTCALVWLGMGGGDLSSDAKRRIESAPALCHSSISAWDIARLAKEGKIGLAVPPGEFLSDLAKHYGLVSLPPDDETMLRAAQLPDFHKDPADRIIIATALLRDLTVVTGDARFPAYGVRTIC